MRVSQSFRPSRDSCPTEHRRRRTGDSVCIMSALDGHFKRRPCIKPVLRHSIATCSFTLLETSLRQASYRCMMETSTIHIRRALLEDAAAIASVLRSAFLDFEHLYTAEAFQATVSSIAQIQQRLSEGPIWIAADKSAVVGTVSVTNKDDTVYIRGMAVSPTARGCGVGRQLLNKVEEYADEHGFRRLCLSTTPFLESAIRLYDQRGFVRSSHGPDNLFGTPLISMEKTISTDPCCEDRSRFPTTDGAAGIAQQDV